MTLNLNKYGAEMQAAWKRVCDINSDINWALYGYEGNTFTLKLLATGSDGLDELKDELNANKIMYAFVRVTDPKTSLPKFVFLHWQGESAAGTQKGKCATHLRDIEKYFHGAHVTVNARNDDEVDEDEILVKVSKATASAFNFKEKPLAMVEEAPAPVGTTHQRIVPQKELPSMNEREKFWVQEESREKERIDAEKVRKISERKVMEEERKRREEEEAKKREESIKERERKISKIRDAETSKKETSSGNWEMQMADDAKDEQERQKRSEELRRARNEEARHLISQRSENPRAVFERNTSVGQLNYRRQISADDSKPKPPIAKQTFAEESKSQIVKNTFAEETKAQIATLPREEEVTRTNVVAEIKAEEVPLAAVKKEELLENTSNSKPLGNMVHTDDIVVPPPDSFGNEDSMKSQPEMVMCEPDVTSGAHQPDLIQDVAASRSVPDVMASTGRHSPAQNNGSATNESDFGICAVALYDYEAADDTEISFDPGQVITHIEQIDQGWWYGFSSGHYGLFPANYVELIDSSEIVQH